MGNLVAENGRNVILHKGFQVLLTSYNNYSIQIKLQFEYSASGVERYSQPGTTKRVERLRAVQIGYGRGHRKDEVWDRRWKCDE